jgi:energy-converting hydrogenase A subunit M
MTVLKTEIVLHLHSNEARMRCIQHIYDSLYTLGLHIITVMENQTMSDQDLHMANRGTKPYLQDKFVASCCKTKKENLNPISQSLFPG